MDDRVKKVVDILLNPQVGMRVRLLQCAHPRHFGNVPLEKSMEHKEATIKEIAPTLIVYVASNEVGTEETSYLMQFEGRNHWWVYRHQFEILLDDDK